MAQIQPFQIQMPNLPSMVMQANQIKQQKQQFQIEAEERQRKYKIEAEKRAMALKKSQIESGIKKLEISNGLLASAIPNDKSSIDSILTKFETIYGPGSGDEMRQLIGPTGMLTPGQLQQTRRQVKALRGKLEDQVEQFGKVQAVTGPEGKQRFGRLNRESGEFEIVPGATPAAKQPTPTPETKLLNEIDALSVNDPRRQVLQRALYKKTSARTTTTEIDPKTGEVIITEGQEPVGTGMGDKVFKRQVQTELKKAAESLQGTLAIENSFNPYFLTFEAKASAIGLNIAEMAGFDLNPTQKTFIVEQSKFARATVKKLNTHIKERTGAQMSEKEVPRLMAEVPNARFFGDGPTRFKSKIDDVILMDKMSVARLHYVVNNGQRAKYGPKLKGIENDFPIIGADGKPDMTMVRIMGKREDELQEIIKQQMPGASQEEIDRQIMDRLSQEFGLIF